MQKAILSVFKTSLNLLDLRKKEYYNKRVPTGNIKIIKMGLDQIFSHPTWDLLLVFFFIAAGFFYGISAGRRRIISALLFTYVTIAVFPLIPIEKIRSLLDIKSVFYLKSAVFLALFFVLYFLLGSKKLKLGFSKGESWWHIFLLSFLQVGLLLHSLFSNLSLEQIKMLAPLTRKFFAGPETKVWWYLLPLAALLITQGLTKNREE